MKKPKKDFPIWIDKTKCPVCNYALYKKYEGMVCKNHKCPLYFKLAKGWTYLDGKKENNLEFFNAKYDFDIIRHENLKEWLRLKSRKFYEAKICEICKSNIQLHVHHILPRSSNPELSLDYENLLLVCLECHKKLHEKDKHNFLH